MKLPILLSLLFVNSISFAESHNIFSPFTKKGVVRGEIETEQAYKQLQSDCEKKYSGNLETGTLTLVATDYYEFAVLGRCISK